MFNNNKIIKANNLSLAIKGKQIIRDVSLEISQGKITSIIGSNGAGKSSLLKLLAAGSYSYTGELIIAGKVAHSYSKLELAKIRAFLSQNCEVNFPFKVSEIVAMGRSPHIVGSESEKDKAIVFDVLRKLSMVDFYNRDFTTLSGGEKQRVQMARVLAQLVCDKGDMRGKILFLDEPTSALDIKYQDSLLAIVKKLVTEQGLTAITVMHDINLVAKYSDDIAMLKDGVLIKSGASEDVLTEANLLELYDVAITAVQYGDRKIFSVA